MLGFRLAYWGARDVAWKWQALHQARKKAVLPPVGMIPASTQGEAEEGSG